MVDFQRFHQTLSVILFAIGCCVKGLEDDYNPLNPRVYKGYARVRGWSLYLTDSSVSAATADFTKGSTEALCRRVVVFLAHGAVLEHLVTECDSPDHSMGLVTQDSAVRYFDDAMVRPAAAGHVVVTKRTREAGKCRSTVYELDEFSTKSPGTKVKKSQISSDTSCKDLDGYSSPPMWLISSTGDVGKFQPVSPEWMTFNPWDSLGFVTREYRYQLTPEWHYSAKCFRLLVVTSFGRPVHGVKLSCGPVSGITSTSTSLRLGDSLHVTREARDTFAVVMNARNSYCIQKTVSVRVEGGRVTRKLLSNNNKLTKEDKTCNLLLSGLDGDAIVDRDAVKNLKSVQIKEIFKQDMLKPYTPSGPLVDYNLGRDLGMMVQTYTKEGDNTRSNIVTFVAKGVPVLPVIVEAGVPQRVVIRQDVVYYGKDVAFTKLFAKRGYQVVKRLDDCHCRRKLFKINSNKELEEEKEEEVEKEAARATLGGTRKESHTTKPECDILHDTDCKILVQGTSLKPDEARSFGDLTDDVGVPTSFPSFLDN